LHRCTFVPADEYLFGFLLLTSTLYFQLGSGSGLDVIKYPTCSNTCPLGTIPDTPLSPQACFAALFFFGPKPSEGGVTTFDFFYFFSGGATTAGVAYFEQAVDGRRKLVFRSTANACSKFEERINIVKFP